MKKIIINVYINDILTRHEQYNRRQLKDIYNQTIMEHIKEMWEEVENWDNNPNNWGKRIKINIMADNGKEWQFMNKAEAESWGFKKYINII